MTFTDPEQGFEGCINSASDVETFGSICSNPIQRFLLSIDGHLQDSATRSQLLSYRGRKVADFLLLDTFVALIFVDDSTNGSTPDRDKAKNSISLGEKAQKFVATM